MSVQEIFDILGEIELHYKDMPNMWAKTNVKEQSPIVEYAGLDA
jgi:hypothetical protein